MHNRTNQFCQKCKSQIFRRYGAAEVDCGERETAKLLQVEWHEVDESKKKLAEVESEIERLQSNIQIADAMVYERNKQLQKLLCSTSKNIERKKIQSAQSKINVGLERKRKLDDNLVRCWEKKKKLQKE